MVERGRSMYHSSSIILFRVKYNQYVFFAVSKFQTIGDCLWPRCQGAAGRATAHEFGGARAEH